MYAFDQGGQVFVLAVAVAVVAAAAAVVMVIVVVLLLLPRRWRRRRLVLLPAAQVVAEGVGRSPKQQSMELDNVVPSETQARDNIPLQLTSHRHVYFFTVRNIVKFRSN